MPFRTTKISTKRQGAKPTVVKRRAVLKTVRKPTTVAGRKLQAQQRPLICEMCRKSMSSVSLISNGQSSSFLPMVNCNASPKRPQLTPLNEVPDVLVDAAVGEALSLHSALMQILKTKTRCKGGSWNQGAEAAGEKAGQMYWDLLRIFNRLFPMSDLGSATQETVDGQSVYSVFEFTGKEVKVKGRKRPDMSQMLEELRSRGPVARATDALLTVLSCIGSRKEMCWIESFDDEKPQRGHFVHVLADPRSVCRLACVPSSFGLTPASLILVENIPMRTALENFDNDGPLKEAPDKFGGKYEFAFQQLIDNEQLGTEDGRIVDERQNVRDLVVSPELTKLIQSNKPVIMLDSYLALAPRELVQSQDLAKVIRAEFEKVLKRAKEEGKAVILQLGGERAHMLAKKVYMRPNFAQFGLTCGYIRWRSGPNAGWGKEQHSDDRTCIGLQMP